MRKKQHLKMSEEEIQIVKMKSEPIDMFEDSNKENVAAPLSCPASFNDGIPVDGRSIVKQMKKKAKRSALAGTFVCLICQKEYVYETFLTRHMVSKHRACEPLHQYKCRHCGAIFADEVGFEKHKSLFFDFLKHHIEHVRPKEEEQENEVLEFEEFVKATAEAADENEPERETGVGNKECGNNRGLEVEELAVDFLLADYDGPAEKRARVESDGGEDSDAF